MKKRFTILAAAFALLAFLAIPMGMRGQTRSEVTYTFSEHYSANTTLTDVAIAFDNSITGTFGKGDGSTAPQYYTNGTAVRWYGGNTLAITASNATISEIVLTYTQKNKTVTTDVGTYVHDNGTWSGSASSVTFTVESGSGHNRVSAIKVTYSASGSTPTCATPTFNPAAGTYTQAQSVSISCSTDGATIYYTTNGQDPTTNSTVYSGAINVSSNTTIKAMAVKSGYDNSAVASATYTFVTPMTIAEVRAQGTGDVVATTGTVTSCVGTTGYIQDATAAICVYGTSLTVGDNISVLGTLADYNGLLEITNPQVTVISSGNTINPELMTIAEAVASTNQGWYIRIEDATVTAISDKNVTIAQGNDNVVVRFANTSDITFEVNNIISLNGNIGAFNGVQIANPQNVTVQENPNPYISAEDVNITYDATSGAIVYTIENEVTGGVLTAATESEWLTLGAVGATVPFTCTANDATTARTATVTLTYTYSRATVTKDVIVTQAAYEVPHYTWNLSIASYASASTEQVTWTCNYATMVVDKANAGTNANNYLGGAQTSTRFYKNSELTITPVAGYAITSVVFDATTTGYASALHASTWTNATATVVDKVVTVTPTDGTIAMMAVISNTCGFTGVTVYYVEDNSPSIAANNMEIAYDATSGAITYTINNPVSGGVLTAATESDWLTLGTVGTTVPFTCTVNTDATPRTATVTLTYTYNRTTVTKNVTVTQAGNPNTIDNISDITEAGTYTVQGTIVAISNRGFILGDGTGYVYYYYGDNFEYGDYDIGDMVKLSGPVVVYGKVYEFNSSTTISYVTHSNYMGETPTVLSGADMDAQVASSSTAQLSSYVQYVGTLSVNGTHYNITNITGATTAIGSISYPLNADEIAALDGKQVKVTGYYVGISSSTYYNTMIGSIEENTEPAILLDTYNIEVAAEGGEGDINVTYQNFDFDVEDYDYAEDLSIYFVDEYQAETTYDWITVEFDANNNVHYIVEANHGEARTAYFIVFYNGVFEDPQDGKLFYAGISSDVVTVTQAAYVAPFEPASYTLVTNYEQLVSGKTYIIVGSKEIEGETHYYAMGEQRTNNRGGVAISVNGTTAMVETAEVHEFIVTVYESGEVNDGKTLKNSDGSLYGTSLSIYDTNEASQGYLYAASSSGNQLKTKAEFDDNGEWGVDFNDETAQFTLVAQGSNTHNVMQFNYNNGSPLFNCYISASQLPVYLYVKEEATTVTQTTNLVAGWNWFSTYVEVEDPVAMLQAIEASLGENGVMIKSSDVYTENDADWGWFGDLDEVGIVNEQMYKILVSSPCTVSVEGTPANPENHPITINQGWNWIGFPCSEAMSLDDAFAGFAQDGDIIRNSDGETPYDADWEMWFGDLETLQPGQGFMYYSASSTPRTLVFNTGAKAN